MTRRTGRLAALTACVACAGAILAPAAGAAPRPTTIKVQLLGINDLHGNLQPPAGSSGRVVTPTGTVDAGGVAYLATHVKQLAATNLKHTFFVGAGDLIGASPLISALFHDEPTIEALNLMGMESSSVGNHEFDEGSTELLRMQNGGCHPVDGCQDGDGFAGAAFQYLSANVFVHATGKTLFPSYKVERLGGAKIAFIGLVLHDTPTIVSPDGVAGLDFTNEVEATNAVVHRLQKRGIHAFVVEIHQGGMQQVANDVNACNTLSGPIIDLANGFDADVDVVLSGHTHQAYNCVLDGKIVTSALSFGRLITDVNLEISKMTNDVVSKSATNVIVTRDVTPDPAVQALVDKYDALSAPLANRPIGTITSDITNTGNAAGESALGDVIADGQLESTADGAHGGAVVAFMNPGGIRASLVYTASGAEGDGVVTYGEAFTVQPFSNVLTTITMTGAQIKAVLEQQFDNGGVGVNKILQVSSGFTYSWSASAPLGSRISDIAINGVPVDPSGLYRVTVNNFLASGGDGFTVFTQGTAPLGGAVDIDSFAAYLGAHSPVAPGPQNRITLVP